MKQKRYPYRKDKRKVFIEFIERDDIWYWRVNEEDIPLQDITINPKLTLYQNLDKIRTMRGSDFVTQIISKL